ncbi:MAG: threonine--tRNA ligase [candidate division WOR-3 bacterium]|nr:threonine--tRNA ligase [candidate division WOR-3 bacterium]MCX7947697.1 threonine--tRNA ligase [candidate division WOR-3 bacterium]MDW8150574.1 threonine--tRNA ligase [candidate division WOR-3 bacterium]
MKLEIIFPDKSTQVYDISENKSLIEIDSALKNYLVAKKDDLLFDLTRPIFEVLNEDCKIEVLDFNSEEGKQVYWHSSAHILAQAVKRLFPNAKLAIGPPTERGFFYDIDFNGKTLTEEDIKKIEEEAYKIIKSDYYVRREEWDSNYAKNFFEEKNETYKVILIEEFNQEKVSVYFQGEFVDLCRGPHIPRTGLVKAFKILSVSGAYFKGDERNPQLQRIYAISFPTEQQLEEFLHFLEEAKKRDHRTIARQLELFEIYEEAGSGLVFFHPKGAILRKILEDYSKEKHLERGYKLVWTPHVLKTDIWKISGHLDYYRENMFIMEEKEEQFGVKPMNCPAHILIYKSKKYSYRDLPLKLFEIATVYRYERSGTLHGLLRVRNITQDDSHIFCAPYQVEEVIVDVLDLAREVLNKFGFHKFEIQLSVRDKSDTSKYMGSSEEWYIAEKALKLALEKLNLEYKVLEGEAAFYGPKIDIHLYDVLDRKWQCSTIQLDFNLPRRFNLTFVDKDGKEKTPIIIHRAIFGSIERFMGILIENYAGEFPFWLSPIQVVIVPVSDKFLDYANKVYNILKQKGFRVELDRRKETVGYKIREAEIQKIPFVFVVGKNEVENEGVSIRKRKVGDLGFKKIDEAISILNEQ